MRFIAKKLLKTHIWRKILLERLTEPLHLNFLSGLVALLGSYRSKVAFDLIVRQPYAFSLLSAADYAKKLGIPAVTAVEFGVAAGAGLLNLCEIAARTTTVTGINFKVVGFDSGKGMPPPRDYRDHPDFYGTGDFPMDKEALLKKLPPNASLVFGDISETAPEFISSLSIREPIGFVSIDLDYYWSTVYALKILEGEPGHYLPLTFMYFDDVGYPEHNKWCGELLALEEFNSLHNMRKITPFNFLREKRIFKNASWIAHMYTLHVLDRPQRSSERAARQVHDNPYL